MCGIVGTVGFLDARAADPVHEALEVLRPRGPDGAHRETSLLGRHPVVLAARRLALVDPAHGRQPIVRPSGSLLVWNGEVYNHAPLRRELEARGQRFAGRNDGEVLAALLDLEGPEGLARVEGSYAFAFLRAPEGPLWLGRDPLGVRPLLVARVRGGLAFASTLDALLALGALDPEPDLEALADVLRDGVVRGRRTALRGVDRVPAGRVLEIGPDLGLRALDLPPCAEPAGEPGVLDALRLAVRDRVRADRPVAVFLSGGVDSAIVAALAREVADVPAYTLAFPGYPQVDEAHRASRTARRLGVEHVEVACPRDPTGWVLGAAEAFDEPFADSSAVPTWGLARAASAAARAVLTGTGGDEVFGGYRRYWLLGAGPWLRHVPGFLLEAAGALLQRPLPGGARILRASADPEGLYRGLLRVLPAVQARAVLGERLAALPEPEGGPGPSSAREAMADDLARYLPDDLLVKEDRALMAHGIEGRHPFLDARVRRAAAAVEQTGSPGRGRQKLVLRAFVREVVDPDLGRVPKRGFAFPVNDLYRGPLRPLLQDILYARRAQERGLMDPGGAHRLLRDHLAGRVEAGAALHALLVLELWARRVLDARPPLGAPTLP